ncbi:MAG: nitroreductase family protein [Candidatus Zixiibacteriota bacterium]|nr:MAG: nitroreductase family protein [candidate division Zixibacteria bacterium]
MSGILFLKTKELGPLREFYVEKVGCEVWLEQADCTIFRHGNFLFGFCQRDTVETDAMLTFFYNGTEEVDRMFDALRDTAVSEPKHNDKYSIYQCFVRDPDGRMVELQYFDDPVIRYLAGDDLLLTRRSVREFLPDEIPREVLTRVLDLSRFAPTSMNRQGYYFRIIRDRQMLGWLSETRSSSTSPIANTPMAVAICADPEVTKRAVQDGCIAAYHFILAAWFYGLGTCWIAAMDRDDIKQRLGIPQDHYIATITPLGYPSQRQIETPPRKPLEEYVKGL